jgi:hypothetical protein
VKSYFSPAININDGRPINRFFAIESSATSGIDGRMLEKQEGVIAERLSDLAMDTALQFKSFSVLHKPGFGEGNGGDSGGHDASLTLRRISLCMEGKLSQVPKAAPSRRCT